MLEMTRPILDAAERAAIDGPIPALRELRKLGLDDFGLVMIKLPNPEYPNLSRVLPRMAPEEMQRTYTGTTDAKLLGHTLAFVWMLRARYVSITGQPLEECKVLDFGCGYGRIIRLMYYLTDPQNIHGVDAWETPLRTCREAGMLGNFSKTTDISGQLDVANGSIDLAYTFSVFTHLNMEAMMAGFAAIRRTMKPAGVLVATVRPIEHWAFLDKNQGRSRAAPFEEEHRRTGFAFELDARTKTYGDSSVSLELLQKIPGWKLESWDRSIHDPLQLAVAFRPV